MLEDGGRSAPILARSPNKNFPAFMLSVHSKSNLFVPLAGHRIGAEEHPGLSSVVFTFLILALTSTVSRLAPESSSTILEHASTHHDI